jgi:hypothetical protein
VSANPGSILATALALGAITSKPKGLRVVSNEDPNATVPTPRILSIGTEDNFDKAFRDMEEIPFSDTTTPPALDVAIGNGRNRKARRRAERRDGNVVTFKRTEYAAFLANKAAEEEKAKRKKKQTAKMKKKARK